MLADVTIDGRPEAEFRLAIEGMLREGAADQAAHFLKSELGWLCGDDKPLPARFLSMTLTDLDISGWDRLAARIGELDAPGDPITAIGVDVCGMQAPLGGTPTLAFETTYYTDQAWGFSHADRTGICAGYQGTTNAWQGAFEDIDDTLRVEGLDNLNAVIAALEQHCLNGSATPDEQRAFVAGACYLAVLIHQAVRDKAKAEGLPRVMAVLVGSNEAYPWFEAPAIAVRDGFAAHQMPQNSEAWDMGLQNTGLRNVAPQAMGSTIPFAREDQPLDLGAPFGEMPKPLFETMPSPFAPSSAPAPSTLSSAPFAPPPLFTGYPEAETFAEEASAPAHLAFTETPRADVMQQGEWDEGDWEEEAGHDEPAPALESQDYAALDAVPYAAQATAPQTIPAIETGDEEALHLPPPGIHVTGTQLRRRFVNRDTLVIEEERRPGLLERLFRRK